jgi:two-component system, NtrC family, sensor kinase
VLVEPATMSRSQQRVEAMRKPPRAGGKPAKARLDSAPRPKGRNAPKPLSNRRSAADESESEVAQLKQELHEALEQQTATSQVLQVIGSSPGDLQPVFETMLENAARVCDAKFGNIYRWDREALHLVATHNTPAPFIEHRRHLPLRIEAKAQRIDPLARMVATKTLVHVADLAAEPNYIERRNPGLVAAVELGGVRTSLLVPIHKENELIGAFALYRPIAAYNVLATAAPNA